MGAAVPVAAAAVGSLVGSKLVQANAPSVSPAPPPPPPPTRDDSGKPDLADERVREVAEEERERNALRTRLGRQQTILTSPLGVTGQPSEVRRKSVLGQ